MSRSFKTFYELERTSVVVNVRSLEVVSLDEAKAQLRITHAHEDQSLTALIKAARMMLERKFNRSLVQAELEMYMDAFPVLNVFQKAPIYLDRSPVLEVTDVSYLDSDDEYVALNADQYRADLTRHSARIEPRGCWPISSPKVGGVRIRYIAGPKENDSNPGIVPNLDISQYAPEDVKHAMLLMIEHLYKGSSAEDMPRAVHSIMNNYCLGV